MILEVNYIQLIFYAFATIAICSGIMVVAASNPVRGVLALVLTFFAMAGIWMLLQAEFLALILVLVYVGAVMTLFLFVVMMLRVNAVGLWEGFVRYLPFALLIVLMMVALAIVALDPKHFGQSVVPIPALKPENYSNTGMLGMLLYTDYAYPFIISGIILLAAIIAAISLSHRKPTDRKIQNPSRQVAVSEKGRVRLIQMPSEKRGS
jgi:NADH-quinone oxidoreductase subunit J